MERLAIEPLEKIIGYTFKNKTLLKESFIHRSYINENYKLGLMHNERLEFLGDAVLELIVTDFLFHKYKDEDEGILTSYRAALVNAQIIGEIARDIGMNSFIMLSKGEMKDDNTKARTIILADTFEAVIGAIYLDGGYAHAKDFISRTILVKTEEVVRKGLFKDAKSMIQELAQEHVGVTPSYRVIDEIGPDHDKRFRIGVYFGETCVAEGKGKSKQEGEQAAARAGLIAQKWITE